MIIQIVVCWLVRCWLVGQSLLQVMIVCVCLLLRATTNDRTRTKGSWFVGLVGWLMDEVGFAGRLVAKPSNTVYRSFITTSCSSPWYCNIVNS